MWKSKIFFLQENKCSCIWHGETVWISQRNCNCQACQENGMLFSWAKKKVYEELTILNTQCKLTQYFTSIFIRFKDKPLKLSMIFFILFMSHRLNWRSTLPEKWWRITSLMEKTHLSIHGLKSRDWLWPSKDQSCNKVLALNGLFKKSVSLCHLFICWSLALFYSDNVHKQWMKVWFLKCQMPNLSDTVVTRFNVLERTWRFWPLNPSDIELSFSFITFFAFRKLFSGECVSEPTWDKAKK